MTELDLKIQAAYQSNGQQEAVNHVYLTFFRTTLFVPVKKQIQKDDLEPFSPLYANIDGKYYLPTFDTLERLQAWAKDIIDDIHFVELTGDDLLAGVNKDVYVCLNIGTAFYKEFSPDEVLHLKKIIGKLAQIQSRNE